MLLLFVSSADLKVNMVHSELGDTSRSLSCCHQVVHFLKNPRSQIASVSETLLPESGESCYFAMWTYANLSIQMLTFKALLTRGA